MLPGKAKPNPATIAEIANPKPPAVNPAFGNVATAATAVSFSSALDDLPGVLESALSAAFSVVLSVEPASVEPDCPSVSPAVASSASPPLVSSAGVSSDGVSSDGVSSAGISSPGTSPPGTSSPGVSPASAPEHVQDAAAQKLYNEVGPSQWVTAYM